MHDTYTSDGHEKTGAEDAAAVFHAHGISKIYTMGEVEVQALRAVTLDLYEGELVVLLGPSGSGKSTLLNILGSLDIPTKGEVYYPDHILTKANDAELTVESSGFTKVSALGVEEQRVNVVMDFVDSQPGSVTVFASTYASLSGKEAMC